MSGFKWHDREYWTGKVRFRDGMLTAEIDGRPVTVQLVRDVAGRVIVNGGEARSVDIAVDGARIWLQTDGVVYQLDRILETGSEDAGEESDGTIRAPMPGLILEVAVSAGDAVAENQLVLRMESMKLQVDISSPVKGLVGSLSVKAGDTVNAGDIVAQITEDGAESE